MGNLFTYEKQHRKSVRFNPNKEIIHIESEELNNPIIDNDNKSIEKQLVKEENNEVQQELIVVVVEEPQQELVVEETKQDEVEEVQQDVSNDINTFLLTQNSQLIDSVNSDMSLPSIPENEDLPSLIDSCNIIN